MPYGREEMNGLLGQYRANMLAWERADPGSREEQRAAADMSSAMATIDDQLAHGAELPSEWVPADQPEVRQWPRNHAQRYLEARYGESWMYRAPETYPNILERWIRAVADGNEDAAEDAMLTIEEGLRQDRNSKAAEARKL